MSRNPQADRSFPSSRAIAIALDRELGARRVHDSSWNGLQVESRRPVRVVAAAVDASLATFEAAVRAGADLLIVHHGLFWGETVTLTPPLIRRVRSLLDYGLSLYASHLPLDRHPRLGNNIQLAWALGLRALKPFGAYHGQVIGWGGSLPQAWTLARLRQRLVRVLGRTPRVWAFGPDRIQRVAVVSGGAGDMAEAAGAMGYHAFVTGEAGHAAFHPSREAGVHVLAGGHYATETFGVKALSKWVSKRFNVKATFIDIPTGM
jgi:dinuclear metal center YbgI/SA1388 family protein